MNPPKKSKISLLPEVDVIASGGLKKYGFRHQRDLAREAVFLAKGGDSAGAIERINVCQCHNDRARNDVNSNQSAVIEYLKSR